MANTSLFSRISATLGWSPRDRVMRNAEGAVAYRRSAEQALAQFASTGCFNGTFYATAGEQLDRVLDLATQVTPEFVAQTAIHARQRGYMKDMPAFLLATLSRRSPALMDRAFDRVVDTPRMLRTFVQIVRSGKAGRRSLGSAPKRCVRRWLDQRTDAAIFAASVGQAPSLADVVRMVHPKPATATRAALYGYLLGRGVADASLPAIVRQFEAFKRDRSNPTPDVPFQFLTALNLTREDWIEVARRASWHTTRMNLNTPLRSLNKRQALGDLVVIISDNESWFDRSVAPDTALMEEWTTFVRRNPRARLVLVDLQPNTTTQLLDREDVLNIGGFSDSVFGLLADLAAGRSSDDHWVKEIRAVAV